MTQKECKASPILAILSGYQEFKKVGEWKEDLRSGRDAGFILELTSPWNERRFLKYSYSLLDEEAETAALKRGEAVWLRYDESDLVGWID